jgi:hypothetical protein
MLGVVGFCENDMINVEILGADLNKETMNQKLIRGKYQPPGVSFQRPKLCVLRRCREERKNVTRHNSQRPAP